MQKILLLAALTTFAFGLGGCAQQETKPAAAPSASAADQAAFQAALSAAKAEQKKAAAVDGEWRDTGKIIKSAEEAAAAGDYAKATGLANKAVAQGRLGQQQAASQVNAGNPAYLY